MKKLLSAVALVALCAITANACWQPVPDPITTLAVAPKITVGGKSSVDGGYYVTIPATIMITTAPINGAAPERIELLEMTMEGAPGRLLISVKAPPVGVAAPIGRNIVNPSHGDSVNWSWTYRIREWSGNHYRDTVIVVYGAGRIRVGQL